MTVLPSGVVRDRDGLGRDGLGLWLPTPLPARKTAKSRGCRSSGHESGISYFIERSLNRHPFTRLLRTSATAWRRLWQFG
jgi:hypothetical protein